MTISLSFTPVWRRNAVVLANRDPSFSTCLGYDFKLQLQKKIKQDLQSSKPLLNDLVTMISAVNIFNNNKKETISNLYKLMKHST